MLDELHHPSVVEMIEGTYDTLPIIRTSLKRSPLFELAIPSKAKRSAC
jgi:hypothetical protein